MGGWCSRPGFCGLRGLGVGVGREKSRFLLGTARLALGRDTACKRPVSQESPVGGVGGVRVG